MRRAILVGCLIGMVLALAGCDEAPKPFELFLLEIDLAVVSFFLALGIGWLARLTSRHLVVKGQKVAVGETTTEGKPAAGGRDAKTSLVIALFVSVLVLAALVATGAIIKKTEFEIPHQKTYFLPRFHLWSFHTIFSEDIYFALMINGWLPYNGFERLVTAIEQKRFAELREESRRRQEAEKPGIDEDELYERGTLSATAFKNLKVGMSLGLTLILFFIPAYVGARARRGIWLVAALFLAVNILFNISFYTSNQYRDVLTPDVIEFPVGGP
ncbi:MAG: hypothetical protein V2A58_15890 [Planctomycetota bacterium]